MRIWVQVHNKQKLGEMMSFPGFFQWTFLFGEFLSDLFQGFKWKKPVVEQLQVVDVIDYESKGRW